MFDNCFPGYELSDDENEDNRPNRDGGSCDEIQPQHESDILPAFASPILASSISNCDFEIFSANDFALWIFSLRFWINES